MAKRLLRREHIVAASLVGSVVVVVGFASGLGTRPATGANAAPTPGGGESPVATAPPTTTQTQTQPPRAGTQPTRTGGGGVIPVTTAPTRPSGTNHIGHPTTPTPPPTTVTPPTPPSTTPPPTACQPGLVPQALTTLLGTLGRATDALGLGGLLGGDPTAALLPTTSLLPGQALTLADGTLLSALPDGTLLLPDGTPLDQFIATCPEATTPATATPDNGHG